MLQEEEWNKPSIYKLPASFLAGGDQNDNMVYMPQMVSFGPYHHEDAQLRQMEYHKHRALGYFLHRSNNTLQTLVDSLKEDQTLVQRLLDSYKPLHVKWGRERNKFLKLMILDGCFMLEILQWEDRAAEASNDDEYYYYAKNDPIFSHHGWIYVMPHIRRDMLMLENQLPMLLLKTLLAVETGKTKEEIDDEKHLNKIILKFLHSKNDTNEQSMGPCLHVLDVYRKSLLKIFQGTRTSKTLVQVCTDWTWIESLLKKFHGSTATGTGNESKNHEDEKFVNKQRGSIITANSIRALDLWVAGVKFKKCDNQSLKEISFEHGVLKLPGILVDDNFESTFLNLMAFERYHVGVGNEVTSYIYFMDNIIDSETDVEILRDNGIIHSALGDDQTVADLFNRISENVSSELIEGCPIEQIQEQMKLYCKSKWHVWRADFKYTHFDSPWALISLFGAILLLVLTFLQTFYAIYGHYKKKA